MADGAHQHLRRLDRIFTKNPVYFVTTCVDGRRPILAQQPVFNIFVDEWTHAQSRHGWSIGRYVVMPDHVHFFAAPHAEAKLLGEFLARWKEWTSKRFVRELNLARPIWQPEFFDHLLRSDESYSEKWDYVRANPVRAGLVTNADEWPYQGFIHFQ